MSPSTARAVSMGLLGGIVIVLFSVQGLLTWAGFIGWASFLEAGGDGAALKKAIAGNVFGALLGWITLLLMLYVVVADNGWMWMPRTGLAVAVTLFILVKSTSVPALSRLSTSLLGYGAVFGAANMAAANMSAPERLTGLSQYNPFLATVLSMVGGAIVGLLSAKLADSLSRK